MSDLDTKLYEILYNDVFLALESGYAGGPSVTQKDIKEEAGILIAQIHHAYRDAGYRYVPKQADIQHLIDDGTVSPLETGQEWYERFEKELDKLIQDDYGQSVYRHTMIEAAKSAAGLTDKEGN